VGAAYPMGSPVELLLLAEFESCGCCGGDRLRLVTWLGFLQFVAEYHGNCPRFLGSVVPTGHDGRSLRVL